MNPLKMIGRILTFPFRMIGRGVARLGAPRVFGLVHLLLASLYLIFILFGTWAKREEANAGALASNGGTGYGLVALVLAVVLVLLALMRLAGRHRLLPGIGVEQLTVILGLAAWMNSIAYIVGWLVTFPAGTGWAAVAAYFPASIIPQVGMLTLSITEPDANVRPIAAGPRRAFSVLALLAGVGVGLFPFLAWLTAGSDSLSAFDGAAGNPRSGPRFGYILLIVGIIVVVGAFMRLRPQGLAEMGNNALAGHALITGGAVAITLPIATLISIQQFGNGLAAGIGLWLGLAAGAAMIAIGWLENRQRGAVGV